MAQDVPVDGHNGHRRAMIDPKYIDKMVPLDVKPECWLSWKFKFVNWMSTTDVRFVHLLPHAENSM